MKNKILKISLISIIVTCILVILTGCTVNNTTNDNNQIEENKVKNEIQNTQENKSVNTKQDTVKTDSQIVEELFLDYLKNVEESSGKKLKGYKIDKVKILSENERKNVVDIYEDAGNNVNEKDIFAEVTYSVKPENIENTEWMAGNGEKQEDWLVNKSACIFIKNNNGVYEIQENGTGW